VKHFILFLFFFVSLEKTGIDWQNRSVVNELKKSLFEEILKKAHSILLTTPMGFSDG
jgi:hypothetical protein